MTDLARRARYHLGRLVSPRLRSESEQWAVPASDLTRELRPGALAADQAVVTNKLFERLEPEEVAELERRIEASGEFEDLPWRAGSSEEAYRRFLLLSLGLWLGVDEVSERTGLTLAIPPDEVHSMTRGPQAAAGGLYEADMVISGLLSAGGDVDAVRRGLDFGCSSGRVVRALAAGYPDVSWSGCDPNGPAIEWARANLPGIEFFVNGNEPPLPIADGELDLVFAISVWSHFEPALGLSWFEEMRRVLRPGGHLVFTSHGLSSVDFLHSHGLRSPAQSVEIRRALYSSGTWYAAEFGEQGDWGVVNSSWGSAFLSPEWVLTNLCPRWRVLEFAPGRNAGNQDVYVAERS